MNKEVEVLKQVRELFSDGRNWCKGWLAIRKNGRSLDFALNPRDPEANAWCLSGAIAKFDPEVSISSGQQTIGNKRVVYKNLLGLDEPLHDFNDAQDNPDEILRRIDNAIGV